MILTGKLLQIRLFPITNIGRIMKDSIPSDYNAKISKDTKKMV